MKLGQFTLGGGFHPGLAQGPFLIPPSFTVPLDALLEQVRNDVRSLYAKLPPDLQAPFTPRLAECNDLAARGDVKAAACLADLRDDLAPVVEKYLKIPLGEKGDDDEPGVSPWIYGAVGAAVLTAIFTLG